eukprot:5028917-Amphidinium_carterae.1
MQSVGDLLARQLKSNSSAKPLHTCTKSMQTKEGVSQAALGFNFRCESLVCLQIAPQVTAAPRVHVAMPCCVGLEQCEAEPSASRARQRPASAGVDCSKERSLKKGRSNHEAIDGNAVQTFGKEIIGPLQLTLFNRREDCYW